MTSSTRRALRDWWLPTAAGAATAASATLAYVLISDPPDGRFAFLILLGAIALAVAYAVMSALCILIVDLVLARFRGGRRALPAKARAFLSALGASLVPLVVYFTPDASHGRHVQLFWLTFVAAPLAFRALASGR